MKRFFIYIALVSGSALFDIFSTVAAQGNAPQIPVEKRVAIQVSEVCVHDNAAGSLESPTPGVIAPFPSGVQELQSGAASMINTSCISMYPVGWSTYDLQTNASISNRFVHGAEGLLAAWTFSADFDSSFPDRGTGFNKERTANIADSLIADGNCEWNYCQWNEAPGQRIESNRTGWPAIAQLDNGNVAIVSHSSIEDSLVLSVRDDSEGYWVETSIPSTLDGGRLWPRMVNGGLDGNTLHVICMSTPVSNGGTLLQGQDGALLYYRSQDGGENWDRVDYTFPQLDSTHFTGFRSDCYAIHARGEMVAIAIFNDLADSFVMVSVDNGESWQMETFLDFPFDLYAVDDVLPVDAENAADFNEDGINEEYFSSDGSGAVHVDIAGKVHVAFGGTYYMDNDSTDETYNYFPGSNQLMYWNEDFGFDSIQTIGYAPDLDGDGELYISNLPSYGVGLASFPSMGSDEVGNLYLTYAALNEISGEYRNQWLIHSLDGGNTWNTENPLHIIPGVDWIYEDEMAWMELVFGSMAPDVEDGKVDILCMMGWTAGTYLNGDHGMDYDEIVHIEIPVEAVNPLVPCISGCSDTLACNFDPSVTSADLNQCSYPGCMDPDAVNYAWDAGCDGECVYLTFDCESIGHWAWVYEETGLFLPEQQAVHGENWEGEWVFHVSEFYTDTLTGTQYGVHHFNLIEIGGLPTWIDEFSIESGEVGPLEQRCITMSGIPDTSGIFQIHAEAEVFLSLFGQPFSIGTHSFSAIIQVFTNPNPILGCTYPLASNYVAYATMDDESCEYPGCTDENAANFNPFANVEDGSCYGECNQDLGSDCPSDSNGDGLISVADLLILLGEYGAECE